MKLSSIQACLLALILATPGAYAAETVGASGGEASTNALGPRIQFAEPQYDFGKVAQGELVKHDYVFTNTGDAMLKVTGVYPSCGCTTPGDWSREVAPGQTGVIPLQFNSSHFSGPVIKTASVMSNAKGQPSVMLQLRGTVWRPIEVTPQTAYMSTVADSPSNAVTVVHIVSSLEQPVALSEPEINNKAFKAELKTIRPGKEFELTVETVPPLKQGMQQGTISIKTSSTQVPIISIMALANIQPAVMVAPPQIVLPPSSTSNVYSRAVTVFNNSGRPMVLSDAAVNAAGVNVQVREIAQGRQFQLLLSFPPGFKIDPAQNVTLSVKTSDAQYPFIKVPLRQFEPPPAPAPMPIRPAAMTPRPHRRPR